MVARRGPAGSLRPDDEDIARWLNEGGRDLAAAERRTGGRPARTGSTSRPGASSGRRRRVVLVGAGVAGLETRG